MFSLIRIVQLAFLVQNDKKWCRITGSLTASAGILVNCE